MTDSRAAHPETYLGDAVYASFDGWQIRLRTNDGNNQVIYLEPAVLSALIRYVDSVQRPGCAPDSPIPEELP